MKKLAVGLLLVLLVISACYGGAPTNAPLPATPATAAESTEPQLQQLDQTRTLASLTKVDGFPLYEMRYYGDYGFGDFLEEGVQSDDATGAYPQGVPEEWACTCFAALAPGSDPIFGRNFDWYVHPALILFADPPDAYASVSMVDISYLGYGQEEPVGDAREGLLDAPYFPFDGLNEYGLAVGIMAVPEADGGDDPDRVTIGTLHVVRLMLDYARSVDQAIALLQDYNVEFEGGPPVHYLVADASGNSAIIEFISGEARAIRNSEPWQVATNFLIHGTAPETRASLCPRYSRAYETLQRANGSIPAAGAMTLLEEVSQSSDFPTIWSVVYNMTSGDVQVVAGRVYGQIHEFNLVMGHE